MDLIEIPAADGPAEAYVSRPPGGSGPGVLFFMDAIGLRPRIADMCDRIASWGYVVLAPNAFYRDGTAAETSPQGDLTAPGEREKFFEEAGPRIGRLTTERAVPDIAAYLTALRATEGVSDGPVGVTGYCMGAGLAVRAATGHPDDVAAAGGFHGARLATDEPDSPHRALGRARAEFVFGHADQDRSMPIEAVQQLEEALQAADRPHLNEIYQGAAHGYSMADTSTYDENATERHFTALQALLQRTIA